jgi:hypothetical protein
MPKNLQSEIFLTTKLVLGFTLLFLLLVFTGFLGRIDWPSVCLSCISPALLLLSDIQSGSCPIFVRNGVGLRWFNANEHEKLENPTRDLLLGFINLFLLLAFVGWTWVGPIDWPSVCATCISLALSLWSNIQSAVGLCVSLGIVGIFAKSFKGITTSHSPTLVVLVLAVVAVSAAAEDIPHHSCTAVVDEMWGPDCMLSVEKTDHMKLCKQKARNCNETCKLNNNKRACQSAKADHSAMCKHRGKGFDYLGEGQGFVAVAPVSAAAEDISLPWTSASISWGTTQSAYCKDNWGRDKKGDNGGCPAMHHRGTHQGCPGQEKETWAACKAKCEACPGCVGVSWRQLTSGSKKECVLCTFEGGEIAANSKWHHAAINRPTDTPYAPVGRAAPVADITPGTNVSQATGFLGCFKAHPMRVDKSSDDPNAVNCKGSLNLGTTNKHNSGCTKWLVYDDDGFLAPIASPSTTWKALRSTMRDDVAVSNAIAKGVTAGSYSLEFGNDGVTYVTVTRAEDMVPAGVAFCKLHGFKYAALYGGGNTLVCGNEYGRRGLARRASCSKQDLTTSKGIALPPAVTGLPVGGDEYAAAVYATSSAVWETNNDFNATAAEAWLLGQDKAALNALASSSKGWGAVEITLTTPTAASYELTLKGADALKYCRNLLNEEGTKTCRLHITFVERHVQVAAESQGRLRLISDTQAVGGSATTGTKKQFDARVHTSRRRGALAKWNAWILVKKRLLCEPSTGFPDKPTQCLNSKECSPDGVQCSEECSVAPAEYDYPGGDELRNYLNVQYNQNDEAEGPGNWAQGSNGEDTFAQFTTDTQEIVNVLQADVCAFS